MSDDFQERLARLRDPAVQATFAERRLSELTEMIADDPRMAHVRTAIDAARELGAAGRYLEAMDLVDETICGDEVVSGPALQTARMAEGNYRGAAYSAGQFDPDYGDGWF